MFALTSTLVTVCTVLNAPPLQLFLKLLTCSCSQMTDCAVFDDMAAVGGGTVPNKNPWMV